MAVGAAALAAWVVLASPLLAARTVAVAGSSRLPAEQVRAAADIPLGTPLARLDTDAIRGRLHSLPSVGAVQVERAWPSTVRLLLTERAAVAVTRRGSQLMQVDASGLAFAPVGGDLPPDAVELVVPTPGPTDRATRAALAVLAGLPGELRTQVRAVSAQSGVSVGLALRNGATVVWGDSQDGERKAAVLGALLRHPAKVYDVSAPGIAVTR
ncbi:MAG: hypothetical protein NVSMB13_20840 [Mycobacteriales bacterium]